MKATFQQIAAFAVLAGVPFSWGEALAAEPSTTCRALAARVAQALNLKPNGDGTNVGYASLVPQGAGAHIRLACPFQGGRALLITLSYPAEYPPALFYAQLAVAGEILTGASAERIRLQAHRCHRAAKRAQGRAHKRAQPARIDCDRTAKSSTFWVRGEGKVQRLSRLLSKQEPATAH
jgi:hypothetical protein